MPQPFPRKRFGQHFLHDPFVIERIIAAIAPRATDRLVEIGPGLGALTLPLLKWAGTLDVVELDRDLLAPLEERCAGCGALRIHQGDALRFHFSDLATDGQPLRLVGNLPYNISTPLLFHVLQEAGAVRDMHFMLQKEVVQRMGAAAGTGAYGRLSVMVQYRCSVEPLFDIGPGAFRPPPQVESSFVRLIAHAVPPVAVRDEAMLAKVVAAAFGQRRKTLRNSLKGLLGPEQIAACGIDAGTRPEQLGLAEFAALANAVARARAPAP